MGGKSARLSGGIAMTADLKKRRASGNLRGMITRGGDREEKIGRKRSGRRQTKERRTASKTGSESGNGGRETHGSRTQTFYLISFMVELLPLLCGMHVRIRESCSWARLLKHCVGAAGRVYWKKIFLSESGGDQVSIQRSSHLETFGEAPGREGGAWDWPWKLEVCIQVITQWFIYRYWFTKIFKKGNIEFSKIWKDVPSNGKLEGELSVCPSLAWHGLAWLVPDPYWFYVSI